MVSDDMSYDLKDFRNKNDGAYRKGCHGAHEYGSGAKVFHLTNQPMPARRDMIGEAFDSAVDDFEDEDHPNAKEDKYPFHSAEVQEESRRHRQHRAQQMQPGVVLFPKQYQQAIQGISEASQAMTEGKWGSSHIDSRKLED
jgi:hypothetical protein